MHFNTVLILKIIIKVFYSFNKNYLRNNWISEKSHLCENPVFPKRKTFFFFQKILNQLYYETEFQCFKKKDVFLGSIL